jgi:hypothetical protein
MGKTTCAHPPGEISVTLAQDLVAPFYSYSRIYVGVGVCFPEPQMDVPY